MTKGPRSLGLGSFSESNLGLNLAWNVAIS